jgi:hypothetical protein
MATPGQKSAALLRDLETSHSVPISPVTEDDKVARSSSDLTYFSADIFSSLQRTPGGETGARSSSHPIHIPSDVLPAFTGHRGRNRCKKFFTPYSFSLGCSPQPSQDTGRRNRCKKFFTPYSYSLGCSPQPSQGTGGRNRRKKFFTPYSYSLGCSLQPSQGTGRRNRCKKFFTPYLNSLGCSPQPSHGTGGRNRCKKFFTPYSYSLACSPRPAEGTGG